MFFFLTPENFKNSKVFQVFKGANERNIGPNRLIGLGTKGLLMDCGNQLDGDRGRGSACTCSIHFDNRSLVFFIKSVTFLCFTFYDCIKQVTSK